MSREPVIVIINYEGNDVILEWKVISANSLSGSTVFSDLQSKIRQAVEKPGFVFQQHNERIYVRPLGKGILAVYSEMKDDEKVRGVEFIDSPIRGKWEHYNVIYQGKIE